MTYSEFDVTAALHLYQAHIINAQELQTITLAISRE